MAVHAGSVYVDVRPDTSGFTTALNAQMASTATTVGRTFSQKLTRASAGLRTVGKSLTRYVSVPLVGIGAVATKMALDFDRAFTQISAVTNTSQKQVAEWRKQVLALAGTTAQSPQELANALYFLASAGLETSQVMEVLESSAQASAAGLGETADIARLSANVLNAYPKSVTDAAEAIDVLVAAVKVGTAEPDEFADSLGRILPIASKAGVGFDEVSASLASLSNIGLDVNEGVTAMRGVLQALVAPGSEAAETLKELGLSADDVRTSLSEDGLLATLDLLEEKSHGQIDVLQDLIPNVRALTGFFGLTEQQASKVAAAFDQVTNSKGELDKAFGKTKKGAAFQFEQTMAELQATAIKLGNQIIPILVQDVIPAIRDAVKWFSELSPEAKKLAVQLGVLAAVAGPLASLASVFIRVGAGLAKVVPWLLKWPKGPFPMPPAVPPGAPGAPGAPVVPVAGAGSAAALGAGFGVAVVGATALLTALDPLGIVSEDLAENFREGDVMLGKFTSQTVAGQGPVDALGRSLRETETQAETTARRALNLEQDLVRLTGKGLKPATAELVAGAIEGGRYEAALGIIRNQVRGAERDVRDNARSMDRAGEAAADLGQKQLGMARSTEEAGKQADDSKGKVEGYTGALNRVPVKVTTNITADATQAFNEIAAAKRALEVLNGSRAYVTIIANREGFFGGSVPDAHTGGLVRHRGGIIPSMHAGGLRSDERMARLQKGEFVMRREAVGRIGIDALTALNRGHGTGSNGPLRIEGDLSIANWRAGRVVMSADARWSNGMRGW